MAENKVRSVLEQIVAEAVENHINALSAEIIEKAAGQLKDMGGAVVYSPGGSPTDLLNAAINSVQDHTSQAEILAALLDGCGKFSERTALFVLRSGNANGWRARGFANNDAVKSITIDGSQGLAARCIGDRLPVSAAAAEFDSHFLSTMGNPADGANVVVLPLVVREKVAALVYADIGPNLNGTLDPSALEALVRCSSLWLEIVAARKAGTPAEMSATPHEAPQAMAAAASAAVPQPVPVAAPEPVYEPEPPRAAPEPVAQPEPEWQAETASPPPAPEPVATPAVISAADEEVHKKAKRFAKLLVDEIKLYNRKKVEEGRKARDLYTRLKDDIEKSRATYEHRYGQTPAGPANYFNQELVRILGDGDKSLLGGGFSG